MGSFSDYLALAALGAFVLFAAWMYGFLLWRHLRLFIAAMIRLRDRIDRSDDSLR